VRLLDTTTPGGSLLQDSKLVVSVDQPNDYTFNWDGIITLDGRMVICPMWRSGSPPPAPRPAIDARIEEFSVATGKLVRTIWPVHMPDEAISWSNPAAASLRCPAPRCQTVSTRCPSSDLFKLHGGSGLPARYKIA
jgi:hypothetical protein